MFLELGRSWAESAGKLCLITALPMLSIRRLGRKETDTSRCHEKWPAVRAITELPVRSDAEQREKKNSNLGDSKKLSENTGASVPLNE